jgi:hypothetical protein
MKIKETFLVTVIITAMIMTLNGCSSNAVIDLAQSNTLEKDNFVGISERNPHYEWIYMLVDDELNFKDKVCKMIDESKRINIRDENYFLYLDNNISDISKFYCLENLEIDGYKLYSVNISRGVFLFRFAPVEKLEGDPDYIFVDDSFIPIQIERFERHNTSLDPLEDVLEEFQRRGQGVLTEDDMVYVEKSGYIFARLGDTIFNIRVPYFDVLDPDKSANYEILRDLAFQVIEAAELVQAEM